MYNQYLSAFLSFSKCSWLYTTACLCTCSLDGAGWVAGVRKDQVAVDDDEKNDVMSDDNYVNMVVCLSSINPLITLSLTYASTSINPLITLSLTYASTSINPLITLSLTYASTSINPLITLSLTYASTSINPLITLSLTYASMTMLLWRGRLRTDQCGK